MRRAASILAAACLALAGCGSGEAQTTETSGSSSGSPTPTGAAGEVLVWADDAHATAIEQAGADYQATTGVAIKVQHIDLSDKDMKQRVEKLAPQGQGPDLFIADSTWVGDLADGGLIVPFDLADRAASFADVAVAGLTYAGQGYGVPLETENLALLRNTALAPEAPKSIEEMASIGLALKDKRKKTVPIALPVGGFGDAYHWYPLYSAAGGYIFGQKSDGSYDPTDVGVGRSGSVAAAEQLADFTERGVLDPDLGIAEALEAFTDGLAPYLIGGPWSVGPAQQAGVPFTVEPVPDSENAITSRAQSLVSTTGILVSAFARNGADAADFLRSSVMTTSFMDAVSSSELAVPAWEESYQKAASDPIVKAFGDVARMSVATPNLSVMDDVWVILSQAELDVMEGAKPKRTMVNAGEDVKSAVEAS